jgi:hypothetical protein
MFPCLKVNETRWSAFRRQNMSLRLSSLALLDRRGANYVLVGSNRLVNGGDSEKVIMALY